MKTLLPLLISCLLLACNSSHAPTPERQPNTPDTISVTTDFNQGKQDWVAGFSDYPQGNAEIFDLVAEIRPLPNDATKNSFLLAGHNRSDDLFMYLKKKISGLAADTRYKLAGEITILTNAGQGCIGIGGAPGESVYFKLGANAIEPKQADYYMNLDIGSQSKGGANAVVLGNIAGEQANCDGSHFVPKKLQLESSKAFEFIASDQGDAWVFIGTDSGFEGLSQVYYQSIALTLTPML